MDQIYIRNSYQLYDPFGGVDGYFFNDNSNVKYILEIPHLVFLNNDLYLLPRTWKLLRIDKNSTL